LGVTVPQLQAESVMSDTIIPVVKQEEERVRWLTEQMVNGEEEAFREFHRLYSDRLFRFLLVLTRGGEDLARELCQTTMVKVVRAIRVFDDEAHLWNWLGSIARNNFIDALRKRRCSPEIVPFETEGEKAAGSVETNESELMTALQEAMEDLEPSERNLLEHFYFEERAQAVIAAEQNTTAKAVESKLGRVRQKLRAILLGKLRYEK
jgi:RNA polymerase sigma-70 factor (ECF subfamily)